MRKGEGNGEEDERERERERERKTDRQGGDRQKEGEKDRVICRGNKRWN